MQKQTNFAVFDKISPVQYARPDSATGTAI